MKKINFLNSLLNTYYISDSKTCNKFWKSIRKWKKPVICGLTASILATAMILSGCSSAAAKSEAGVLNLYCWTEYIPDSVIQRFTEETGIKVNVTTFSSNEDMLNKIKTDSEGTYDLCQPSDYMVKTMINQDLLEPISLEKIPNIENISDLYLDPAYDPGNQYSIPYMGGVATLAVNTEVITDSITSFDDIFQDKYSNQLVVLNDFRAVIGMTAKSMGYGMSETDETILDEIQEKMLLLKPNIKAFDSDNPKSLLISGEVALAYCWSAEIALAMRENSAIEIIYPEEGAYLFMDNFVIPKGAKNIENVHMFLNFILDPEVSTMVSEEFPYLNPNEAAIELLDNTFKNNIASNPPEDVIKKGEYIEEVGDKVEIYDKMWTELTK